MSTHTKTYHYMYEVAEDLLHDLNLSEIVHSDDLLKLVTLYCLDHPCKGPRQLSRTLYQAYQDMRSVILGDTAPLDTTLKCFNAFVSRFPWYYGCMLISTLLRERKPS